MSEDDTKSIEDKIFPTNDPVLRRHWVRTYREGQRDAETIRRVAERLGPRAPRPSGRRKRRGGLERD